MSDDKDSESTYADATIGKKKKKVSRHDDSATKFEGETVGLEGDIFIYGKKMGEMCLKSKEAFISYMGRKCGASEKQSLEKGVLTIVGSKHPTKFKNKTDFENLDYYEQEKWRIAIKNYEAKSDRVANNLARSYSILWDQCDVVLKRKIKLHHKYETVKDEEDVMTLLSIISEICNSTSTVTHYTARMVESLYNLLLVDGNKHSLTDYTTYFEERAKAATACGVIFHSEGHQKSILGEAAIDCAEKTPHDLSTVSALYKETVDVVKELADERMLAFIFMKRAGYEYEELRIKMENDWNAGANTYPVTINDAYVRLETFRSSNKLVNNNNSKYNRSGKNEGSKASTGLSFNQEAQQAKKSKQMCFQCERIGHVTRKCDEEKKEDGSALNTKEQQEVHWEAFKKNKESGEQHVIDSEIVDSESAKAEDFNFEDVLDEDECEAGYGFCTVGINSNSHLKVVEDLRGMDDHVFNQKGKGKLNQFDVLFDNQSTVNVICCAFFLVNIRKCPKELYLYTNAGCVIIDMVGDLPGVGTVWYHPKGIANILSHTRTIADNGFEVDYSSRPDENGKRDLAYRIETSEGKVLRFSPNKKGLHCLDCSKYFGAGKKGFVFGNKVTQTTMGSSPLRGIACNNNGVEAIKTVKGNKKNFTKRDVKKAELLRRFQHVSGHPSDATLHHTTKTNGIKNSPFSPQDVKLMSDILGKSIFGMKGKAVRRQPSAVEDETVDLPQSVKDHYMNITLAVDVMHVNKIPILISVSRKIHYGTVASLVSMKIPVMETAIKKIISSYGVRGFLVKVLMVDLQFQAIKKRNNLTGVFVNVVSRDEHVEDIERLIRLYKERLRCYWSMMPFDKIPKVMAVELIKTTCMYVNAFTLKSGVSEFLSPLTLVEGTQLDFHKHFQVIFGEYAQTFEGSDNTMKERTVGAIALGPSGNFQGGVRFFSLKTGKVLNRNKNDFTVLPIPEDVVTRVNQMATVEGLTVGDRNNDNLITLDEFHINNNDDVEITGVTNPDIQIETQDDENEMPDLQEPEYPADSDDEDDEASLPGLQERDGPGYETDSDDESDDEYDDDDDDDDGDSMGSLIEQDRIDLENGYESDDDSDAEDGFETEATTTRSGRTVRPYRDKTDEDFTYTQVESDLSPEKIKVIHNDAEVQNYMDSLTKIENSAEYQDHLYALMFTQLSIKQGIKSYPVEGKASIMKELDNMVLRDVFGEVKYESLSPQQRKWALPILLFMVMKRNGTLKSRACADGRGQRVWTNKEDVSSPTPSIDALKYTLVVDAQEKRDVATVDLPAQFLQTDMDEEIHLRVSGPLALLLVERDNAKWSKHLRKENGRPVIYVLCKKAIYGTLNAAILAYKKLTKFFIDWGFTMNAYEPCVWNKSINNKQCTIVFHVDDLKISHEDGTVVTLIIKKLEKEYASHPTLNDKLTIRRGKKHEYLGMTIIIDDGEVRILMYDYVARLIKSLPVDMIGSKKTTAPEYLFKTDGDGVLLSAQMKELFHNITARTLWLSQRGRPDLQLTVGFMCTRVREPNDHDWKKLTHAMKYLQATRFLPLILRADGKGTAIYLDGSHAVHMDMKGHAGMYVTEGKGASMSSAGKTKLNTVSSTETEIVVVGEKLPRCVWYRHFRIEQSPDRVANEDVMYQDNKSTMLLMNNGIYSAGKGSKHIHVRYYFITDRIKNKEFKIMYCPTEEMIADFFTKPLQGAQFYKFRNAILGIKAEDFAQYEKEYDQILKEYGLIEKENA